MTYRTGPCSHPAAASWAAGPPLGRSRPCNCLHRVRTIDRKCVGAGVWRMCGSGGKAVAGRQLRREGGTRLRAPGSRSLHSHGSPHDTERPAKGVHHKLMHCCLSLCSFSGSQHLSLYFFASPRSSHISTSPRCSFPLEKSAHRVCFGWERGHHGPRRCGDPERDPTHPALQSGGAMGGAAGLAARRAPTFLSPRPAQPPDGPAAPTAVRGWAAGRQDGRRGRSRGGATRTLADRRGAAAGAHRAGRLPQQGEAPMPPIGRLGEATGRDGRRP